MPNAPESLVEIDVSPLGKYLLCALAGFTVGVVLGVTLASLIERVDSLPENATITPIRPRATTIVDEPDDEPDEEHKLVPKVPAEPEE